MGEATRDERGQATLEAIAAVPAILLTGLLCLQLLAAGYALNLADGAAESGAIALAARREAEPAALEALPAWARESASVAVNGGRVSVALRPPSPFEGLAKRLEVRSSAWVRPPSG